MLVLGKVCISEGFADSSPSLVLPYSCTPLRWDTIALTTGMHVAFPRLDFDFLGAGAHSKHTSPNIPTQIGYKKAVNDHKAERNEK